MVKDQSESYVSLCTSTTLTIAAVLADVRGLTRTVVGVEANISTRAIVHTRTWLAVIHIWRLQQRNY